MTEFKYFTDHLRKEILKKRNVLEKHRYQVYVTQRNFKKCIELRNYKNVTKVTKT